MGFGAGLTRDPRPRDLTSFLPSNLQAFTFAASRPAFEIPLDIGGRAPDPVGILNDILRGAKTVGQDILRAVIPDPFEAAANVFFPDITKTILGPNVFTGRLPPSTIPGTPPFFPGGRTPTGTIDVGVLDPSAVDDFFENLPRDVNAPGGGIFGIPESPGIFDDLIRGIGEPGGLLRDILPELIPAAGPILDIVDVFFPEGVFADTGGFQALPDEDVFEDPFLNPPFVGEPEDLDMAEGDLGVCPPRQRLPQCISVQQWQALGRPDGYVMDRGGFLRKKRTRRKRPLTQQAKDDLGWAKSVFGQGKAFDNVVARMRL